MTLDSQQNCHKPISRSKCWYLLLLLVHCIWHYKMHIYHSGGQGGIFTPPKKNTQGENTKIFIEFILFLFLKQINHRDRVWHFSCFPECRSSRRALRRFSPTLISGEKNCGTVVTTHFSAKGQKAWKQIQGKAEMTGRARVSQLHLLRNKLLCGWR